MNDKEAIEMMQRCREEIQALRKEIDTLRPKADAYDNIGVILGLLPRQSMGMAPDLVWTINKRIAEIEALISAEKANGQKAEVFE